MEVGSDGAGRTSQALRASSPSRGASGEKARPCGMPKPPLDRGGGIAQAMTERFSPLRLTVMLSFVQPLSLLRSQLPYRGEPLAKPFTLRGLPKPLLQGATATTAASGGNREELLGPRPAGCERQRSRRWEPQPGQWHRVSDDGEVGLRQSLSFVGKSGSLHRFLYLFVEVYGILILHPVPAH